MENLNIESTECTPSIFFDFNNNTLKITGESYPENTSKFYEPIFNWLEEYLEQVKDQTVAMNIEIVYFNSSSSKILMDLFDMLEEEAEQEKNIVVNWYYDKENDMALEYGEEFKEDLESLTFNLVEIESS
ncbi:SiaC family regulatory phosphoprotein domain-containing protein [Candidatus Magnetomoraceae bacterium gMMP-15]